MKKEIIKEITELLQECGFVSFYGRNIVFHCDSSKYDLMGIRYIEEDDMVEVEGVGYSSFALKYFDAKELSTKTLQMILNELIICLDEK